VPESKVRKTAEKKKLVKQKRDDLEQRKTAARLAPGGRNWVPWVFVPVGLLGVIWMVVWNLAGRSVPFMQAIGNWNLAIGIGLIIASFSLMTLWK
jgi:hypothetical protein